MADDLTGKQRLFCHEYMKDFNGTQAAIRAGYSEKSAQMIASENLSKPMVSEYLDKLRQKVIKKVEIEVDDILNDIIETRREAAEDKKYSDRLKANELLGKYKKMWVDQVESKNTNTHQFSEADRGLVEEYLNVLKSGDKLNPEKET